MQKFSPFNRFKKICKRISKYEGLPLSQVQQQQARKAGYADLHELQTCVKKVPHDSRLVEHVFGHDGFDGSEILADEALHLFINNILMDELAGEVASTNALDFYLDVFEVDHTNYCDETGVLSLKGTAILSGEADDDRPYAGSQIFADATVELLYCDIECEWSLNGGRSALKIDSVCNDLDLDNEPLQYLP